ncbi:hypothetical protein [Massilia sp. BJB1822]|uniref:hypothetical protein n=1 Tax=Massilia sp. BJB1822 TaxID=2744470 RepID=UPI00159436DC|nr:hypothetical protein [Massilia sp. BJB1822]NVE00669.1 hypothetical protein [Massilia sp. BJB1822]
MLVYLICSCNNEHIKIHANFPDNISGFEDRHFPPHQEMTEAPSFLSMKFLAGRQIVSIGVSSKKDKSVVKLNFPPSIVWRRSLADAIGGQGGDAIEASP